MKKLIASLLAILVIPIFLTTPSYAAESKSDKGFVTAQSIDGVTVEASIKSSLPNESVNAVIEEEPVDNRLFGTSSEDQIIKSYKVSYIIPRSEQSSSPITPSSSQGGSKGEVGATANITIIYNKNGDLIDIQRVYGGWTPENSLYYLTDREVIYRADSITAGKVEKKSPTSNSFNYYPGWGNVLYYPNTAYSSTGAFSWATIRVSGMTAYYNIELNVKI
ncbi:hypothetical protein ACFQ3W_06535 [Paenibacillus puldeungensis]|uniref:Uncharacterized protein n=1 Tax=Paenibacillus puldeungensis TaxID=696536 RepID=A0ABW3RV01_9BACL